MLFFFLFILEIVCLFFLSQILTKSLSGAFLILTKNQKLAVSLMAVLFFPGVVVHELSHLITAGIFFVPTGEIEFLPKVMGDTVKLGSVSIAKTDPIRRAIIGFAPVIAGLFIIFGIAYYLTSFSSLESVFGRFWTSQNDGLFRWINFLVNIIAFYLLFAVANTMFSSKKDLEGTIELLIVIVIIFIAFYAIGVRANVSIPSIFIDKASELAKQIALFLLAPLAIDIALIGVLKILMPKNRLTN